MRRTLDGGGTCDANAKGDAWRGSTATRSVTLCAGGWCSLASKTAAANLGSVWPWPHSQSTHPRRGGEHSWLGLESAVMHLGGGFTREAERGTETAVIGLQWQLAAQPLRLCYSWSLRCLQASRLSLAMGTSAIDVLETLQASTANCSLPSNS